jgi:hypothetical protein
MEYYATIIDVAYARNYYRETSLHYEGRTNREDMLILYGVDKVYAPETCLVDKTAATHKADRLEAFFKTPRAVISNIPVINHPGLRVYDIITVDLRIPIEQHGVPYQAAVLCGGEPRESVLFGTYPEEIIRLDTGDDDGESRRIFGGVITCKVMSVSLDIQTAVNTISVLEVG